MSGPQPEPYTLFCLIEDEDIPFSVEIELSKTVAQLKNKIFELNKNTLDSIDPRKLALYRVAIKDDEHMQTNVKQEMSSNPSPLKATTRLTKYFGGTPDDDVVINVIVKAPLNETRENRKRMREEGSDDTDEPVRKKGPRHSGSKSIVASPEWCKRQDTVSGILELLRKYHLVQVRGTPASGKTTLMHLLHAHIVNERPDAEVFIRKSWPEKSQRERLLAEDLPGYPSFEEGERYFIFDEGHSTYWDETLWVAFKDYIQFSTKPVYAILFCSYGNEDVSDDGLPTPLAFGDGVVTLDRTNPALSKPCGLLLDEEEFRDVVKLKLPKLLLADDLRDFVYRFTRGHIGAIIAVIDFLLKKRESSMLKGEAYDLENFRGDTASYDEFCRHLSMDRGILRGKPKTPSHYAPAMRALLLHGSIHFESEGVDGDILSSLRKGYRRGFVDMSGDLYTFASPLHQQLWSWHLLPQTDYELPFQDLFSFVRGTVRPSQLDGSDRRVGSASHRPPEAQYQEEYYRCVHTLTEGNVRISPEYAAAAGSRLGRIDFFIPSKKWGIELTREGSKLNEHNSRFAYDGAYGQWLESSAMVDYVLLDFRSTMPTRAHPDIDNLYFVFFNNDKTQLNIYDNQLNHRHSQNLMQQV